jgi:hypothetical protein
MMATRHEIKCINKSDRFNEHERIINVGGVNDDSTQWKITQAQAIAGIENKKWEFYGHRGGQIVNVIVSTSRYGNKYLKTVIDGDQPNNLLSLIECP